jgi:hypothetical protein
MSAVSSSSKKMCREQKMINGLTPDVTSYHTISGPTGGPEGPWPVVIEGEDGVGEGEWYKPTVDDEKGDIGRGGP